MNTRALPLSLLLAAAVSAQNIHLKTRTLDTGQTVFVPRLADASPARHWIVQFDHTPGVEDLDSLAGEAQVIAALPDNAVMVNGSRLQLAAHHELRWIGALSPEDKISPAFTGADDQPVSAVIEFHSDVDRSGQDDLMTRLGLTALRPSALLPIHVLVNETPQVLRHIAAEDEIAYIFPAGEDLTAGTPISSCAGMLTMSGPVAQYATAVHGWQLDSDQTAHLSYVFGSITPKVPAATVQSEVQRAMNEWARNVAVVFQPGSSAAAVRTIYIKFVSGAHGDSYPFDGPGGTLAHTYYPVPVNPESIAGDMHLDADENWHAGGDVDIYSVALHELGHAIGLAHSDKPGDVMYPYYRRGVGLSANDIAAALSLYGAPPSSVTAPPPVSIPAPALHLSINPVSSSAAASVALTGTIGGGAAPWSVQWQSDQGYAGKGSVTSAGAWTASGISLLTGANNITVTGYDANHAAASQSLVVNKTATSAPVSGGAPISVTVTSPAGTVISTSLPSLTAAGNASGGSGITRVVWQTVAGASGTATGTDRWTAAGIPLLTGTNTIVIRAWDARGISAWASLVVVRR